MKLQALPRRVARTIWRWGRMPYWTLFSLGLAKIRDKLATLGNLRKPSSPPVCYRPAPEELLRSRQQLERILAENLLPFWSFQVIDGEEGGYRLNHNLLGQWQGPANKGLVSQARTVWFFSRLQLQPAPGQSCSPDHRRRESDSSASRSWVVSPDSSVSPSDDGERRPPPSDGCL